MRALQAATVSARAVSSMRAGYLRAVLRDSARSRGATSSVLRTGISLRHGAAREMTEKRCLIPRAAEVPVGSVLTHNLLKARPVSDGSGNVLVL